MADALTLEATVQWRPRAGAFPPPWSTRLSSLLLAALYPHPPGRGPSLAATTVGSRGASHPSPPPSPPPSPHQSTLLPASKRALKTPQRILTTPNGQDARLGSP